jgi:hypothetical protein
MRRRQWSRSCSEKKRRKRKLRLDRLYSLYLFCALTERGPPAYAGTDFIVARNGRIARSISFSTIFLKAKCAASSETLDDEWQSDFWMLTA